MLPTINLTANRRFQIRNFQEDVNATLNANRGLRYNGAIKGFFRFSGEYYLINPQGDLIESFEIIILVKSTYPNVFPIVISQDDKIKRCEDYHIDSNGIICFEHTYVTNELAQKGLRLYDFANYFLPKYFSWVLVKDHGNPNALQEWKHKKEGTKQLYCSLLDTTDEKIIRHFLFNYTRSKKINRNENCYCGSEKKLKRCHLEVAHFLSATPKSDLIQDLELFNFPE